MPKPNMRENQRMSMRNLDLDPNMRELVRENQRMSMINLGL